ncbi:MAG TPA: hypothetical protein PKW21_15845, partial [Rhabdaerophilum sp.]|nr:hypothetical protein [Rhabdaerophilum sp.]
SFDTMAQDLMKQALQPPPKGGLDNALEMARKAGVAIDMPGAGVPPKSASAEPAPQAAAEEALERDETAGLPVPKASSSKGHERSPWRIEAQATVKATPASVLAFYRKELVALGWKETAPARTEGAKTIVGYAAADGPGVLTLTRKGQETSISLLLRKEAEAKKSGMMPKAGQAKILIGNMHDTAATVIVGGKTFKVAPGVGSEKPDGPSLDVPPGNHKVTIKIAGSPDSTEIVTVQGNDIWGVLIGPGGALPVQMY